MVPILVALITGTLGLVGIPLLAWSQFKFRAENAEQHSAVETLLSVIVQDAQATRADSHATRIDGGVVRKEVFELRNHMFLVDGKVDVLDGRVRHLELSPTGDTNAQASTD